MIRDATDADWPAIWPFLREIIRSGETYTWPRGVSEGEASRRWMLPAPWSVFVAVDNDGSTILGTAKVGPNQDGPGRHVANASFMVDAARSAKGVGRQLAEHVIDVAGRSGYKAMQFNAVVETNSRAVRLWQSLGFKILATVPEAFDHPTEGLVGLHVMHRRL